MSASKKFALWLAATLAGATLAISAWDQLLARPLRFLITWCAIMWLAVVWELAAFWWSSRKPDKVLPRPSTLLSALVSPSVSSATTLFVKEEDLREASRRTPRPEDLDDRSRMAIQQRLKDSKRLPQVSEAITQARARGWWDYLSLRLWYGLMLTAPAPLLMLWLDNEVPVAQFDDGYTPLVFRAALGMCDPDPTDQTVSSRELSHLALHEPLLDALLKAGADLHAKDLQERNLFERLLDEADERLVSVARFSHQPTLEAAPGLKVLFERGLEPPADAPARLRAQADQMDPVEGDQLRQLAAAIERQRMEADTGQAAAPRPATRL